MGNSVDLTGLTFGMLTVLRKNVARSGKNTYWDYQCDCGVLGSTATAKLNGGQKSCGCHTRDEIGKRSLTHGHTVNREVSPTYRCYRAMIARCIYPSQVYYPDYGGRGISVCDRWMHGNDGQAGFECFLSDMGEKPVGTTIDRIDNDGNYEPGNCRWVTQKENCRNTRATKLNAQLVAEIRESYSLGRTQTSLARQFGLSQAHVSDVVRHAVW